MADFWSIMKVNGILLFFMIFDFDPYNRLVQTVINCYKQNEQILFDDKWYWIASNLIPNLSYLLYYT